MIPQEWRKDLLDRAMVACEELKIQETTLGNKILNDADFFPNIRNEKGCGVDRYRRVVAWFDEHFPKEPVVTKKSQSPKPKRKPRQAKS